MDFGVRGIQKCKKFSADNFFFFFFFFAFLSRHYGFTNCFEILNFVFSNIIPIQGLIQKVKSKHQW